VVNFSAMDMLFHFHFFIHFHLADVLYKQPRNLVAYRDVVESFLKTPYSFHLVVSDSSLHITLPSNHLSTVYTKSKSTKKKFIYFCIEYPVENLFKSI